MIEVSLGGFKPKCGFIPLSGPTLLSTQGFRWNVNGEMAIGKLVSESNEFSEEIVTISADKAIVFSIELM